MISKLKQILVVEDAVDQRLTLECLIKRQGLVVVTAADGFQAIELLEKNHFDLVISDFDMPGLNGVELIQWCRARSLFLPVILLSTNFQELETIRIEPVDCCAVVIRKKPVGLSLLNAIMLAAENYNHDIDCAFKCLKDAIDEHFGRT